MIREDDCVVNVSGQHIHKNYGYESFFFAAYVLRN